jgi:hypothetical protein
VSPVGSNRRHHIAHGAAGAHPQLWHTRNGALFSEMTLPTGVTETLSAVSDFSSPKFWTQCAAMLGFCAGTAPTAAMLSCCTNDFRYCAPAGNFSAVGPRLVGHGRYPASGIDTFPATSRLSSELSTLQKAQCMHCGSSVKSHVSFFKRSY